MMLVVVFVVVVVVGLVVGLVVRLVILFFWHHIRDVVHAETHHATKAKSVIGLRWSCLVYPLVVGPDVCIDLFKEVWVRVENKLATLRARSFLWLLFLLRALLYCLGCLLLSLRGRCGNRLLALICFGHVGALFESAAAFVLLCVVGSSMLCLDGGVVPTD